MPRKFRLSRRWAARGVDRDITALSRHFGERVRLVSIFHEYGLLQPMKGLAHGVPCTCRGGVPANISMKSQSSSLMIVLFH
jgi:hypothetical protein